MNETVTSTPVIPTEPAVVNQTHHCRRPVCHAWLTTVQCLITLHFLALGG